MLQHSTLTLWADLKTYAFEYSWILSEILETDEKNTQEYETEYQSNAKT